MVTLTQLWYFPDIRICKNVDCQISLLVRFCLTHLSLSSHPKHSNHRALLVLVSFKIIFVQHKVLALELEASKMLNFNTKHACLGVWSAKNDHTHIAGAPGLYHNISKKWDVVAATNKKTFRTDRRPIIVWKAASANLASHNISDDDDYDESNKAGGSILFQDRTIESLGILNSLFCAD